ncbi:hypothetical protein B9479_003515 [Cryptococcus floricola]|uniref:hydroxymethylglutaryl-CoA lyase n=1 Tax=Cryptococcus floricola TaxID=2591691 RepID=A0A5D3AZP8_9TREE|nr:hypothetical protein B9479_003515 [Cryptococcus floricola]
MPSIPRSLLSRRSPTALSTRRLAHSHPATMRDHSDSTFVSTPFTPPSSAATASPLPLPTAFNRYSATQEFPKQHVTSVYPPSPPLSEKDAFMPSPPPTRPLSRELKTSSHINPDGRFIRIVEVSPRDGLQNLKGKVVPTEIKKELVEKLLWAGVRCVEVGSFVRGDWVPQMADTPKLLPLLPAYTNPPPPPDPSSPSLTHHIPIPPSAQSIHYPVLVPNMKGLDNLLHLQSSSQASGGGALTDEIAVFVSASEPFSQANNHSSISSVLSSLPPLIARAKENNLRVRGYVSCVITCPFSGPTDVEQVVDVAERLLNMGCYEVSMGDTTGEGDVEGWGRLWKVMKRRGLDMSKVAAHCHDTFALALPSLLSLLPAGLQTIDASLSGLGGCPYSPGATGNIPTEDVVYALHKAGYETGVDLDRLVQVGRWLCGVLGVEGESRVGRGIAGRREGRERGEREGRGERASGEETEDGM